MCRSAMHHLRHGAVDGLAPVIPRCVLIGPHAVRGNMEDHRSHKDLRRSPHLGDVARLDRAPTRKPEKMGRPLEAGDVEEWGPVLSVALLRLAGCPHPTPNTAVIPRRLTLAADSA